MWFQSESIITTNKEQHLMMPPDFVCILSQNGNRRKKFSLSMFSCNQNFADEIWIPFKLNDKITISKYQAMNLKLRWDNCGHYPIWNTGWDNIGQYPTLNNWFSLFYFLIWQICWETKESCVHSIFLTLILFKWFPITV